MVSWKLEAQQKHFKWLIIAVFAMIVVRLGMLQLMDVSKYSTEAANNQFRFVSILAPRGDIVDRNGVVLATNTIADTISIVPQETSTSQLNTTINNLVALLQATYPDIDAAYINKLLNNASQTGQSYEPVVIKQDVPMNVVERLEEHRQDMPGVQIGKAFVRYYPEGTVASHVLGYIGEINSDRIGRAPK